MTFSSKRLVRFIPIGILVTLAVTLTVVRLSHRSRSTSPAPVPTASAKTTTDAVAIVDLGDASVPANAARQLHGSARHTHRAGANGPMFAKVPKWTFDTGGPVEAQIVASPDEMTLYAASLSGKLFAVDRDGKQRFVFDLGNRVYATPLCADDGTIYVGSDAKKLVALAPDGTRKWELEVDDEIDAAITRTSKCIAFAAGRALYCVRTDGSVAWRVDGKGKIFSAPAVADDLVVFGAQDHHLYAAKDGKVVFSIDLGADVDASPAIDDDGTIHVGTDAGEVVTVNTTGTILRRVKLGGFVRGALAIARNGDVLAGVYGPTPRSVRIARDGSIRSALAVQGTGATEFGVHGAPLEDASGHLYFGAQDDLLYATTASHEVLFTFRTSGDVDAPVTLLSDGALAFASDDGKVYYLAP